jgi:osmotically-inducible protein OsmY
MSAHQQADTVPEQPAPGECHITLLAVCRLRGSGYGALHSVGCAFDSGVLHLRGRVPSYYLKQVAQSLVVDLEGVRQVINRLEVSSQARDAGPAVKSTD